MARSNTNWKPSFYGVKNEVDDTNSVHSNRPEHEIPHQNNCQLLLTSDNNQFLDHIYETIDDDNLPEDITDSSFEPCQRAPPKIYFSRRTAFNKEHPTSSYDYEQQPVTVVFENRQNASQMSCTMPKDCHIPHSLDEVKLLRERNQNRSGKRQKSFSDVSSTLKSCQENPKNSLTERQIYTQKNSSELYEPSLPDLLQNPADNSIVLAVLDGNKVVSKIQPDEALIQPHYKLSTYC